MTTNENNSPIGSVYERIADLPLDIEGYHLDGIERETSGGFTRTTTVVSLQGDGQTGRGEDVTYDSAEHHALIARDPAFPSDGEYTLASFSETLDKIDLFPGREPRETFRHYRRWGFECAALDLALKQANLSLAEALDREYDPVRFVVSPGLGTPPTADPIHTWLDINPDLEFKINASDGWTPALVDEFVAADAIRIVDMKDQSGGQPVEEQPDSDLYRLIVDELSDVIIEDPAVTDTTRPILAGVRERLSWDGPITGVESIRALSFEPSWLNIKPSRFSTVESLFDTIEYCLEHDIQMYGGGQFELGVGREQLHALASVFYPTGPNDIAPTGYNDPEPRTDLPSNPLTSPMNPEGFGWG